MLLSLTCLMLHPMFLIGLKILALLVIGRLALWAHQKINNRDANRMLALVAGAVLIGIAVTLLPPH